MILARRQVRQAAQLVLDTLTGVVVLSPGDWETPPKNFPEIKLRCGNDTKTATAKQAPTFTTQVTLEIIARVQAATDVDAQDALEALGQRIEAAVFGCVPLVRIIQQVSSVTTQTQISAEGEQHIGALLMTAQFEVFEAFDPIELDPSLAVTLAQMNVHVDTIRPVDKISTYAIPPFPDSVTPAPRTVGPNGRDEGHIQITIPG